MKQLTVAHTKLVNICTQLRKTYVRVTQSYVENPRRAGKTTTPDIRVLQGAGGGLGGVLRGFT